MEIVSRPDIRSSEGAAAYVKKIRTILRYIGACDGDMEKGNLRADVNVSVRKPGDELGTRCKIKNVNTYRYIQQANKNETHHQNKNQEDNNKNNQKTHQNEPNKSETRSM